MEMGWLELVAQGRMSDEGQLQVEAADFQIGEGEQEENRRRDVENRVRLESRIEWIRARKQEGSEQSNMRMGGDPVGVQEKRQGSSWKSQFM